MARNKMEDLRDHLFASLERLSDESLTTDQLQAEVMRSEAIKDVASQIISSAKVEVDFVKAVGGMGTNSALFSTVREPKGLQI
jgi:hypothetical protein